MALKPITLWGHASGPNPKKIIILLEELNLPYEITWMEFTDLKKPDFEAINPNGRVPAIKDPNTGITLWESGAIIEYLIETYDTSHALSYSTATEQWASRAWLYFQVSGQGPYYGQMAWFAMFHHEKLPSALERYANEIKRVVGMTDRHLAKQGTPYLVGDRCTYADLAHHPWSAAVPRMLPDVDLEKEYPNYLAWQQRVAGREAVKKMEKMMEEVEKKK